MRYFSLLVVVLFGLSPLLAKEITIESPGLFPEGIAYDASRNEFLVTSLTKGVVSRVSRTGRIRGFIDDKDLISAIGIKLDVQRNRIIVCSSDVGVSEKTSPKTQKKIAGVGIYSAKSGKRIQFIDLGTLNDGDNFANDIAIDNAGNIYITNSLSPIIYKVDINYQATLFLQSEQFRGDGFNLNGVDYHKNGFLLVAKSVGGKLFKVPLDNPEAFSEVELEDTIEGADGIALINEHRLAVISNMQNTIFILESDLNWESAKVVEKYSADNVEFPTTVTLVNGELYFINSRINQLFKGNRTIKEFEIYNLKDLALKN